MNRILHCALACLAGALVSTSTIAASVTLADVKYSDAVSLQGRPLLLNGAGIRYKAVFKVYTAGLYLEKKAATPHEVVATPGPKRLSITMLREIDSSELGKLFADGMEDNLDRTSFSKLVPSVLRMSQIFSNYKKLAPGDTFSIDWLPGTGTVITVKGVVQGEPFQEPAFFNALMGIWLGNKPADWKLKDALLGKE